MDDRIALDCSSSSDTSRGVHGGFRDVTSRMRKGELHDHKSIEIALGKGSCQHVLSIERTLSLRRCISSANGSSVSGPCCAV